MEEDLVYRKIRNYMRRQISNNKTNNLINKLFGLFYKTIEGIPINQIISEEDFKNNIKLFPSFFSEVDKEKIIEIYNKQVSPKKPINVNYDLYLYNDYEINDNNYLIISLKTFRPIYDENWKKSAEELNGIPLNKQQSFYADYLRYYLKFKSFPFNENEFINYIYYKYKRPVHKDIKNVYNNLLKSYEPVKDYIKEKQLTYNQVKEIIVKSTPIIKRMEIQEIELKK